MMPQTRRPFAHTLQSVASTLLAAVAVLAAFVTPADASHFRYGHLTWQPLGGNSARFTLVSAFRRSRYTGTASDGLPRVGDVVNDPTEAFMLFGDGTRAPSSGTLFWKVTSIDVPNDWLVALALQPGSATKTTIDHTYPAPKNGANPWNAEVNDVARLDDEVNNPSGGYRFIATVDLTGGRSSIVSSMPPIVNVTCVNPNVQFLVPASNPNSGSHTVFRLATSAEASDPSFGIFRQPGPPNAANAVSINPNTGLYSWNTNGAQCGRLYSTQVVMEDRDATGALKGQVAVDFLMKLVSCPPGNAPPAFVAPSPANGSTLMARVGSPLSVTVSASDPNPGTDVILNSAGLPAGALATPGLPVSANPAATTVSWTPVLADVGDRVVSFTATDPCGAQSLRSFTIRVVQNHAPVAVAGPDTTVECASTTTTPVQLSGLRSTDPEGDALTYQWSASGVTFDDDHSATPIGQFPQGSSTVTLTVSDGEFTNSASRVVTVADATPPVVTLNGASPMTIECHTPFTDPGATASDVCAGPLLVGVSGAVDANTPGTYTLTYGATDGTNLASVTRTVHVVDTTAPIVTLVGASPMTVECHGAFTDPGATASDACAGPLSVSASGAVDVNTPGSYTRTYTASDGTQSGSATRTVNVVDTTAPVVTLNGADPMTVECHGTFTDPGATALDACVGDVSASIVVSGALNLNTPGAYILTYTASDGARTGGAARTVNVVDTTAPVVTLNGANPMTVECHGTFTDPGATAFDACVGAVPVTVTGSVDPNTGGSYTLTYRASDGGRTGTATRTVNVVDHTPPTISVALSPGTLWPPNRKLVDVHATVTASDNCDQSLLITLTSITLTCGGTPWSLKDPSMPISAGANLGTADFDFQLRAEKSPNGGCDPTYTIVYTATDRAGLSTSASASVRVPHDQRGHAAAAGTGGAAGATIGGRARPLIIVIPSTVREIASEDGDITDVGLGGTRATALAFDARGVDAAQIWLGTSGGLIQPTSVERTDVDGDGFEDLRVSFGTAGLQQLSSLPITLDDPMTLYYRTRAGIGYEVEGVLASGWQERFLPDPGLARAGAPAAQGTTELAIPRVTRLGAGAPNPARGSMTFALDLASEGEARLEVYDLRGALVRTLVRGTQPAGRHLVMWDGTDARGQRVANGIYLVRAEAGAYRATHKAVFVK